MLANAEVLKQARGGRLVPVPGERIAIEQHAPRPKDAAGHGDGRRVEQHHVDRVGSHLAGGGTEDGQPRSVGVRCREP